MKIRRRQYWVWERVTTNSFLKYVSLIRVFLRITSVSNEKSIPIQNTTCFIFQTSGLFMLNMLVYQGDALMDNES